MGKNINLNFHSSLKSRSLRRENLQIPIRFSSNNLRNILAVLEEFFVGSQNSSSQTLLIAKITYHEINY